MSIGEGFATVLKTIVPFVEKEAERETSLEDYKRRILAQHALNRKKEGDNKRTIIDSFAGDVGDTVKDNLANLNIATLNKLSTMSAQGIQVLQQEENGPGSLGGGWTIVNPTPGTVSSADRMRLSASTGLASLAAVGPDPDALRKAWGTINSDVKNEIIRMQIGIGGNRTAAMYTFAKNAGLIEERKGSNQQDIWVVNKKPGSPAEAILKRNKIDINNINASNRGKAISILVESEATKNLMLRTLSNSGITFSDAEKIKSEIENNRRNLASLPAMADKASAEVGADAEEPTSATQLVAEGAVRWLADEYSKERFDTEIPNALSKGVTKSQHINVLSDNILEDFKRNNWIMKDRTDEVIMQYIIKYLDEQYDMAAENL